MPTKININKSYLLRDILYLPIIKKTNKKIVADISRYEATLAGAKCSRLILIAINADPQIADSIKRSNILFKGSNLSRNYILFFGVGISTVSTVFI